MIQKYVGSFEFICGHSNFDGEVIKHQQNLNHEFVEHFQVFKKVKTNYTFRKKSFGFLYMKLVFSQLFQVN